VTSAVRLFAVIRSQGPAWDHTRPMEEQADWDAHAAFMDGLVDEGFVAVGGPLEGTTDVLLVVRASDGAEVAERLGVDPWVQNGLLMLRQTAPWWIRLGALA
jgi:hypothetical protein